MSNPDTYADRVVRGPETALSPSEPRPTLEWWPSVGSGPGLASMGPRQAQSV
jgi:hypothetical protein